jgi:hypothetical protein
MHADALPHTWSVNMMAYLVSVRDCIRGVCIYMEHIDLIHYITEGDVPTLRE